MASWGCRRRTAWAPAHSRNDDTPHSIGLSPPRRKKGDRIAQAFDLRAQFGCCRRNFLRRGGVLLCDLIEPLDRLVDLGRADVLLALAENIPPTRSAVRRVSGTIRSSIRPASCAVITLVVESIEISAAAAWLLSAGLRTSEATTANPRPCLPARVASTAALSASRSVWGAIS